jgi:hypothetical protein
MMNHLHHLVSTLSRPEKMVGHGNRLFNLSKAMLGSQDSACDEIVRTKFIFLEIPK